MNIAHKAPHAGTQANYFRHPLALTRPLEDGRVEVYSKETGESSILDRHEGILMNLCKRPRTLESHAQFCHEQLSRIPAEPHLSLDEVKGTLLGLVASGYLLSETFIRERCRQFSSVSPAKNRISDLAIVTRERPESLLTCLSSFITNAQSHDRKSRYIVSDDTRRPSDRDETRQALQRLAQKKGVEIAYYGLEEKRQLARRVVAVGDVPEAVLDFALFDAEDCGESTLGANRNALFLLTVGKLVFCADDDVVCRIAAAPGADDEPLVGRVDRLHEFWFYPHREAVLEAVEFIESDILSLHEEFLGGRVADYLAQKDGHFSLSELEPKFFESLIARKSTIRLSYTGTLGDSAMKSSSRYLNLEGPSRARLLASEEDYLTACRSREVLKSSTRPLITDNSWCMGTVYAFDNRGLLPPFFPVMRNSDGVYGQTLRATLDDACYAHLPYTLLHTPPEQRSYDNEIKENVASFMSSFNIVISCIRGLSAPDGQMRGTGDNIERLGRHLTFIGSLPLAEFEEFVRLQLTRSLNAQATALERVLRIHRRSPAYWAKDVEQYLETLRKTLLKDRFIPINLARGRGAEEASLLIQRLVYKFGQLLCYWPAIIETSGALTPAS
jgi:hypothetical protein